MDVAATLARRPRWPVLLFAVALGNAGCGAMARVEEPTFTTKVREGDFELRRYGPRVVAETVVEGDWGEAGNEGFRRLAGYIFGKNGGRAEIPMTAPVAQRADSGGTKLAMTAPVAQRQEASGSRPAWTVAFMMPAGETLASLPRPEDARVMLRERPPVEVAVVRFSGRWTDANVHEHTEALRGWVRGRGLRAVSEPEVNRYDPPFKPWFLRRNEVWLEVLPTE